MTEQFDYIILGGGTAGCVLANRLSENGRHRVLLVEGGGEPKSMWIDIPAGFSKLLVDPVYNWRFTSEPEPATYDRQISIPRGKGLGGSTLINGMIWVRGQARDFDQWAQKGATGWSFADVLPWFRKIEDFAGEEGETRHKGGPVPVTEVGLRPELAEAFIHAAQEAGYPRNPDYNDGSQEGFGYYQVNQKKGRRISAEKAYLAPARKRPNLRVETNAHILRLEIEGRRVTGATWRKNGRDITMSAGREVVLCAGAVQTPQILELSGIGNPDLLARCGIETRHALRGVGENYQDHYCTRMNWRVTKPVTLNEQTRGLSLPRAVLQYFSTRKGILTLGTGMAAGFVKTRPDLEDADIQYFFMHASYADAAKRILDHQPGMTIGVTQLRPESVGSIHIRTADPYAQPAIAPNFLSSPADLIVMRRGMQIARDIVGQKALAPYVAHEMSPGPDCASEADWDEFTRRNGQTIYHNAGTAKMGTDPMAVVDPSLKLHGLAGLRITDASVMPTVVAGNTQAAVFMIAEKAADLILGSAG
ncbi:GMC family oxidoreductase N-terminal domain-containing protein [Gemmobacter sp. 24YEA27]|uniref:GMC family oxidoreductase n=1 Tax=Gemmobacter sp. 24YEA27 TaxID=3040672 RepID=UPI0024B372DE|nr:GMC family oxidoreductase N-terminal domain-containing protein [Gemmobacter sp. 24YEA27]